MDTSDREEPRPDTSDLDERELEALRSVSHGAVVSIAGISSRKALDFLLNFALTQGLTVALYGVYALSEQINQILRRLGPLGSNETLLRYISKYHDDGRRQDQILGLVYFTTLITSLTLGLLLFVFADQINQWMINHAAFPTALRLFALFLPFNVFLTVLIYLFRSLELVEYQIFLSEFAKPATRLFGVVIALALGYSLFGAITAFLIATAICAITAFVLVHVKTSLRPRRGWSRGDTVEFYNYSAPNAISQVGQIFQSRIDIILIGLFLTADAAGIYNLAVFLTSIILIPLIAFNQLLPPIASRLYTDGHHDLLNSIYSTITRLVFTGAILIACIQFVYRIELLSVFGEAYTAGSYVLIVFIIGRMVNCAVGATMWLLLMTDHQYVRMINSWALGTMNVTFSYVFILEFGLIGAALGTATSMALINIVRLIELWYLEGLQPFDRTYVKPLAAAIGSTVVMYGLRYVLEGTVLLVVGMTVGIAVFGSLLYLFGIERRDRELFHGLAMGYRETYSARVDR